MVHRGTLLIFDEKWMVQFNDIPFIDTCEHHKMGGSAWFWFAISIEHKWGVLCKNTTVVQSLLGSYSKPPPFTSFFDRLLVSRLSF